MQGAKHKGLIDIWKFKADPTNTGTNSWQRVYRVIEKQNSSDTTTRDIFNGSYFGLTFRMSDDASTLAVYSQYSTSTRQGIRQVMTNPEPAPRPTFNPNNYYQEFGVGSVSVYSLTETDYQLRYFLQPQIIVGAWLYNYSRFGNAIALSGDGRRLAAGSADENSDAENINQESSVINDAPLSGAVWLYQF